MDRMDWMTTLKVAHMLADLPEAEERQELTELSEILGVNTKYTCRDEGNVVNEVRVYIQEPPLGIVSTYSHWELLRSYGAWNEVWARLVVKDLDMAASPYWERDNDLSAMMGYGSEDSECGVFYHRYDEGNMEFKVITPYADVFYTPFHLLNDQFRKDNW